MPGLFGINILGTVLVIGGILLVSGIKILREYERGVIFRLGRMVDPRGPGIIYVIPLIERMVRYCFGLLAALPHCLSRTEGTREGRITPQCSRQTARRFRRCSIVGVSVALL